MNTNLLKLIINAAEIADFEIDETKTLEDVYEKAYQAMRDYATENPDEFEVVEGEFSNHYSHLFARAKDGTEYECDGQIVDGNEEGGEIVGDFIDQEGKIVLVIYRDEIKRYMHSWTGNVDTREGWIASIDDQELEENFKEGTTKQEAFDEYCRDGKFVEVQKDIHGEWKEV